MTAAERLVALAGHGGTAAALLLAIGTGGTAGAALVNYSGLASGTAAAHLQTERTSAVPPAPTSPIGAGDAPARTSRNSDPDAYRSDRVSSRLKSVTISGREYDPFDPTLLDRITEYAAMPEPEHADENQRQASKLARFISVDDGQKKVNVPVFRPTLSMLPDLKTSGIDDFEQHAKQAVIAANEEYRRIVILLSATVELL